MSASPEIDASASTSCGMARIIEGAPNERQSNVYSARFRVGWGCELHRAILAGLSIVLLATPSVADEPPTPPPKRPKVVLVLSGGGARGAAHIGVIKKLEEYHVPVDMVVGTSMGSIVGGLYASGWSIDEIEKKISTIDWGSVFNDKLPRQVRTFRRKTDDARFLVPVKMRFKGWKPYIPPALLGGQNMELLFQGMEIAATGERVFDNFPIPYRAVATDLSDGNVVVIDHGSLATAMRASMSVPGVFPPVELDGKPLTDGGLAANFPIRVARGLGADIVIGVDITTPLRQKEQLGNLLTRLDQTSSLLTVRNRTDDMKAVKPDDVIMIPELGDISFSDFSSAPDAIKAGEQAAEARELRLRELSVSDAEWAAFQARHHRRPTSDLVVDEVRITNEGPLSDAIVARRIDVPLGQPLDQAKLSSQLTRLYGLDVFSPIHHDFVREDGKGVLKIDAPAKPYGRNSLQFGFNLSEDFRGDTGYNLTLSHLMNPVNRMGGEWRNIVQMGENALLATEYYQPLDTHMHWFVSPDIVLRQDKLRFYDANGNAHAEYRINGGQAEIDGGKVFSNWGQLSVGVFRAEESAHLQVGAPVLPSGVVDDGGAALKFRVDTLDSVTWPRNGVHVEGSYQQSIESFGAQSSANTERLNVTAVKMFGKDVVLGAVEGSRTSSDTLATSSKYFLGGFLHLSGLAQNQLVGDRGVFSRFMYYRELTKFDLGSLTQRMYAGFSLEGGNVYNPGDPLTWESLRYSAAIFAGADTVVGPAYLGYGYAQGGRTSFYLIIGQRF
jgi:NTE family protein